MAEPVGCAEAVRRLWDYLDRGLDGADQARVDAHLAFCVRCCGELEFAKELRGLLRERTGGIPDDVRGRLEHFIDALGDGPGGTEAR